MPKSPVRCGAPLAPLPVAASPFRVLITVVAPVERVRTITSPVALASVTAASTSSAVVTKATREPLWLIDGLEDATGASASVSGPPSVPCRLSHVVTFVASTRV